MTGGQGPEGVRVEIENAITAGDEASLAETAAAFERLYEQGVDVGVINAIPRERAALEAVFGKPRLLPRIVGISSMNYVVVDRLDGTRAVVALAKTAGMGIAQAAVATADLKQCEPKLSKVILCGIAAGQPNVTCEERDIHVGDVVISDSVVQYDHVKRSAGGKLEYRGSAMDAPDYELSGVARELKQEMESSAPWTWEAAITRGVANWSDAARPKRTLDTNAAHRTYKCKFHRQSGERTHVHIGPIGSANILLKDAVFRDQVHEEHGTLAYEMEGAGVALAAPSIGLRYILVRGICDYADDKKNDKWQRHAALAAAAVTWSLIAKR